MVNKLKSKIDNKVFNTMFQVKRKLMLTELSENNKGMGVVEVILIILVLVGLVVIFRTKITAIVNLLFSKITSKIKTF